MRAKKTLRCADWPRAGHPANVRSRSSSRENDAVPYRLRPRALPTVVPGHANPTLGLALGKNARRTPWAWAVMEVAVIARKPRPYRTLCCDRHPATCAALCTQHCTSNLAQPTSHDSRARPAGAQGPGLRGSRCPLARSASPDTVAGTSTRMAWSSDGLAGRGRERHKAAVRRTRQRRFGRSGGSSEKWQAGTVQAVVRTVVVSF